MTLQAQSTVEYNFLSTTVPSCPSNHGQFNNGSCVWGFNLPVSSSLSYSLRPFDDLLHLLMGWIVATVDDLTSQFPECV